MVMQKIIERVPTTIMS